MGDTYLIYTEMKIDGKWRCIDGYRYYKPYSKNEEKLALYCTYINGSRSYFGDTYDKLREIGSMTKFSDLSQEIQNEHPGLKYESNFYGEDTKNEACYVTVNLNTFYDMVPPGFQCHGVIHKDVLELYKTGEIDELYQDEDLDFNNMTDIEKQCYEYFEWDNKYSWFYYFKKLKDIVTNTVNKYYNNEFEFETNETRLVVFCL